jgi:hypothetical protein
MAARLGRAGRAARIRLLWPIRVGDRSVHASGRPTRHLGRQDPRGFGPQGLVWSTAGPYVTHLDVFTVTSPALCRSKPPIAQRRARTFWSSVLVVLLALAVGSGVEALASHCEAESLLDGCETEESLFEDRRTRAARRPAGVPQSGVHPGLHPPAPRVAFVAFSDIPARVESGREKKIPTSQPVELSDSRDVLR